MEESSWWQNPARDQHEGQFPICISGGIIAPSRLCFWRAIFMHDMIDRFVTWVQLRPDIRAGVVLGSCAPELTHRPLKKVTYLFGEALASLAKMAIGSGSRVGNHRAKAV